MLTAEKTQECLIKPFKSKISKRPVTPGLRVTRGEWSKRLDNMGFRDWAGEDEPKERRADFENHIRWGIAHRNYQVLQPCISIDDEYNEATQQLDYTIDLYGDGSVAKQGKLSITRGDYLMSYLRMHKHRRKEAIISRIALANVGMLVPYVRLDDLSYDDPRTQVQVAYRIVL